MILSLGGAAPMADWPAAGGVPARPHGGVPAQHPLFPRREYSMPMRLQTAAVSQRARRLYADVPAQCRLSTQRMGTLERPSCGQRGSVDEGPRAIAVHGRMRQVRPGAVARRLVGAKKPWASLECTTVTCGRRGRSARPVTSRSQPRAPCVEHERSRRSPSSWLYPPFGASHGSATTVRYFAGAVNCATARAGIKKGKGDSLRGRRPRTPTLTRAMPSATGAINGAMPSAVGQIFWSKTIC